MAPKEKEQEKEKPRERHHLIRTPDQELGHRIAGAINVGTLQHLETVRASKKVEDSDGTLSDHVEHTRALDLLWSIPSLVQKASAEGVRRTFLVCAQTDMEKRIAAFVRSKFKSFDINYGNIRVVEGDREIPEKGTERALFIEW